MNICAVIQVQRPKPPTEPLDLLDGKGSLSCWRTPQWQPIYAPHFGVFWEMTSLSPAMAWEVPCGVPKHKKAMVCLIREKQ